MADYNLVFNSTGPRLRLGLTGTQGPAGIGGGASDGDKGDITVSGTGTIWTIDTGVVTSAKTHVDVQTSLGKADTALQPASIGVSVQAHSAVLSATTASFLTADETKLDGIEAGAEVNNISDVNAADLTDGGNTTLHIHDSRYYTEGEVDTALSGKANSSHTHAQGDITDLTSDLAGKQATLVSGTNIKTINSTSLLGSGDIVISGGLSDGDKGDITVTASGATWTIDNGVVTLAKQADMASASVVYRKTGGAGAPEVQTLATLKTDLGLTGTNSGDQDLSSYATTSAVASGYQPLATVLTNTTASFTTADETKLDAITGTNTGDNAINSLYSGLVTNANHTGDATGSTALTLATVNSNVGSFTNSNVTVNAKGLVTACASGTAVGVIGQLATIACAITCVFDGMGVALVVGSKVYLEVPFAMTITGWTIISDVSGSCVIDVWKDTYANYPPVVGDSIAGTEKPTLSSATKNQDLSLSTWTTLAVASGDTLVFNVDSATTVTKVTVVLRGTRTA